MRVVFLVCIIGLAAAATPNAKPAEEVTIDDLKVGVLEKDATDVSGTSNVAQFSKHAKLLEADPKKRVYVSFTVKKKAGGAAFKPHQAFLVFTNQKTGLDVYFTSDSTTTTYTFDLNLAKVHKDFEGQAGKYNMRVIVGDAAIKNPIDWTFAEIGLALPEAPIEIVPKSQKIEYNALPEIKHMFRQPDPRPAAFMSDAFTLICLAPLALLLILWARIGTNFSNMPVSLWTLFFHLGLAALFGLYFLFWLQLNMFETLKYLALVGAFTFIAGNRVLRAIADKRKSKQE